MPERQKRLTPAGLGEAGESLWRDVVESYDLDRHETLLLTEACRVADRLDRLAEEVSRSPLTIQNVKGDLVAHPSAVEARQQAIVLSRLLASLRLPSGETETGELVRPQRRGAARGSYPPRRIAS